MVQKLHFRVNPTEKVCMIFEFIAFSPKNESDGIWGQVHQVDAEKSRSLFPVCVFSPANDLQVVDFTRICCSFTASKTNTHAAGWLQYLTLVLSARMCSG